MQCHDAALSLSQPFERSVALRLDLHPLCSLGDEQDHTVRLVNKPGTFSPRFICLHHSCLESSHRREQFFQHTHASHKLVRRGWMAIGTLADKKQPPGFWRFVRSGGGKAEDDEQRCAQKQWQES